MNKLILLVLTILISQASLAQKTYDLDFFVGLLNQPRELINNPELRSFEKHWRSIFEPGTGNLHPCLLLRKNELIHIIELRYMNETAYFSRYYDLPGLKTQCSKKKVLAYIQTLGDDAQIEIIEEGPNGDIIITYKEKQTIKFEIYKRKLYALVIKIKEEYVDTDSKFYIDEKEKSRKKKTQNKAEKMLVDGIYYSGPLMSDGEMPKFSVEAALEYPTFIIEGKFKKMKSIPDRKYIITKKGENYNYEGMVDDKMRPHGARGYLETDEFTVERGYFKNGELIHGDIKYKKNVKGRPVKGRIVDGVFVGETRITLEDGMTYEGKVNGEGQPHGEGRIKFKDGNNIRVTMQNGEIITASGKRRLIDGTELHGNFDKKLQLHGGGTKILPNKTQYSGDWEHGEYKGGSGVIKSNDGEYVGDINAQLKPHGKGTMSFENGQKISSSFVNGEFVPGKCEITYSDGGVYIGSVNGKGERHGQGKFSKGSEYYQGNFIENKFQGGEGLIAYSDGTKYEGELNAAQKPHGKGKNYRGSSEYIEGTFGNGALTSGKIKRKYSNGWYYNGMANSKGDPHGAGRLSTEEIYDNELFSMNLVTVEGTFENGKIIGTAQIENKQGDYSYVGEVNSSFTPHGNGKIKFHNGSGKWESGRFVNGMKQ